MPGESTKDLVIRLAFEHGDTRQQISAINSELRLLESGLAVSAAQAAGFSGALNQAKAEGEGLKQAVALQEQMVAKYGEAIEKANAQLKQSVEAHKAQGERIEALKAEHEGLIAEKQRLAEAMKAEAKANGDNTMAYLEMDQRMDALKASIQETEAALTKEEAAFERSGKAITRNAQSVTKLTTQQNQAKAALAEMERRLKAHSALLTAVADKTEAWGEAWKGAGQWQQGAGRTLSRVSGAILGVGYAAADAAIGWESSFAGVRKTVDGTEAELRQINDALLSMEVPTDYGELADIAANAGQLGIATGNVVGFTRTMADLAETTDLTADAAATAFAQYANITQMPQENIDRLGSVTVALGNNLATTESKIVAFAQAIGAAGSQAGMTDQQIFGISGGLASLGLEAQAGGTAFSKAIIGMKVAAETGSDKLRQYAEVAGMTAEQFRESFSADAAGTFIRFVQGLSSGSKSAIVMLDEMGVTETRLRDALLRASNASDLMTRAVDMANGAWRDNTALQAEAAVRYGTTASKMAMTGKQAQRVAMDFGGAIMPYLNKGLEGVQGLIDKFNGLSDAQRDGVVRWAAYAAAAGPALAVIGKANTALGGAASGVSKFAKALAEGGGGARDFLGALNGLLGPAGMLALVGGVGLAAYKLYDYASGAKAAREAQEALNAAAKAWSETQAATLYDTGTQDPLARFGLTKASFTGAEQAAQDWMAQLVAVWTDGEAETRETVQGFVDSFRAGSDGVRDAVEGQRTLLEGYGALTPEARAQMDADLAQLADWDAEVRALLEARRNGLLSEEDQARLSEIMEARAQIRVKYELDADGYEQIVTQMQAEIERLKAAGQEGDGGALYGDALNALADGRRAYMEALNGSYDAEYAQIQLIDDEAARQAALSALNARYNAQRLEGEAAYADAAREAGRAAWEDGGYTEQVRQIDQLVAALGEGERVDLPALAKLTEGLDEGALTSALAMVEQLKASGMSDAELGDLGIDYDDIMGKVDAIRQLTEGVEGLEGLNAMFGQALPEEIQRVLVGLDMTQAAADWEAFAAGESLTAIKASVEADAAQEIALSGVINALTLAEGVTFEADGEGNVTAVHWPESARQVLDAEGNVVAVETAEGLRFAVDGDGRVTGVTVAEGIAPPELSAAARVRLNPLDQASIAAWQAQNRGVRIEGPKAKVGVQLGAGWADALKRSYDAGLLAVYGADGARLDVTPEVLEKISAQDVAMVDEDGTMHVVITAKLGTAEGVAQSTEQMASTPLDGTVLAPLAASAQDTVGQVNALNADMAALQATIDAMKASGEPYDEFGSSLSDLETRAATTSGVIGDMVSGLNDADLAAIGGQIVNLMAALETGEGTPEQLAAWQAQLAELLTFLDGIDETQYTVTGTNVMAGIAQGMQSYGWDGDASTVAAAVRAAINGALGVASPATTMVPTGEYTAAGIGKGMAGYAFAGDAARVSANLAGALSRLPTQGRGAGANFAAGLSAGITAGRSGVVAAARDVAEAAAQAARQALDIHSPSRVTEGFGRMFDLGFVRGIERELPAISRAVEEALYPAPPRPAAGTVVTNTTDSRDMSVQNAIQVDRLEVRDARDVQSISRELYALIRRDQRMIGGG